MSVNKSDRDAEPQFSQPFRQILTMIVIISLVSAGAWVAHGPILEVVQANVYLNGVIIAVFVIGVVSCLWQVFGLISSVSWIEGFAMSRAGHEYVNPPRLLTSLATLLRGRGRSTHISASSARSILDSLATRLDETREITRYIINLLIFLGLLGTFYGLATTVPAVVDTIRSLAPSDDDSGVEIFGRLMTGLEAQLGGMGTAFASSLLGLAGSLVVGLLDLFTGHGQNRFYRELEEWLSTITTVGLSSAEGAGGPAYDASGAELAIHRMAESIDALHQTFIQAESTQSETAERIAQLTGALQALPLGKQSEGGTSEAMEKALVDQTRLLSRIAAGQDKLSDVLSKQTEDGIDPESRMRLRSMDIRLLSILEEISAGRQDTMSELRAELAVVTKAIKMLSRKPPVQPGGGG